MSTATKKAKTTRQTRQKQRADAARMPEQSIDGAEVRVGKKADLIAAFQYQSIMSVGRMIDRSSLGHQEMDVLIRDWLAAGKLEKLAGFPVRYCYKGGYD